jgi:hypothetical protein
LLVCCACANGEKYGKTGKPFLTKQHSAPCTLC